MNVGANIKKRRYELRMSQQELADAMGYKTRSTIAKIESGENDVSHKKLQRFAEALDTTVEHLISGYSQAKVDEVAVEDGSRTQKSVAVILAGGKSGRNLQNIPNQFINVNGKPIIVYCMEAYQSHPSVDDIYVVCLKGWENIVKAYAERYGITKLRGLIPAGPSGILSLKNAVDHVKDKYSPNDLMIIQESTRPMVTAETVSKLLQSSSEKGSATICHSMGDYVQFDVSGSHPKYVDRDAVIAMQSPEAHRISIMQKVFQKAERLNHPLTESCCTMLLYNLGYKINFIKSNVNNIKIMREEDIATFGALVK
ncbi:MAG: XRE family transcriptional regulator [Clostridia bacterium]|nr:XRE family transcriptional regulator [Clostridia bacterium]